MPYRASVARVAASNTPTYPGELGSATPNPMIPCSRNAPTAGTGNPNARKHVANAAAFTSQSTADQTTTATKRPGLLSTSSPATNPSAMRVIRSATRAGRPACGTLPISARQVVGRSIHGAETTRLTPTQPTWSLGMETGRRARATVATRRPPFPRRTPATRSRALTPCSAQASSPSVIPSPTTHAHREAAARSGASGTGTGLEGEGNEVADFFDEGAE